MIGSLLALLYMTRRSILLISRTTNNNQVASTCPTLGSSRFNTLAVSHLKATCSNTF